MRIMKIINIKVVLGVFLLGIFLFVVPSDSLAVVDVTYDTKLADQQDNDYAPIDKVVVARITAPEGIQFGDSNEWIKGFYYYSITKLGFRDIPFNYVVSWGGSSYKGKDGENDVLPLVKKSESEGFESSLLIGYFDNGREVTNSGRFALSEVLSEVLSLYNLEKSSVVAGDVSLYREEGEVPVSNLVVKESRDSQWRKVITEALEMVVVDPHPRIYKGEIGEIVYAEEVKAAENFAVKVEIINKGDFPWYNDGPHRVYVSTSGPRNHDSKFYIPDNWDSMNKVVVQKEKFVLPGQTATFEFEIATPLIGGDYSESYELIEMPDSWIDGTMFELRFKVNPGDYDLIEVLPTETGYLNVRDCPTIRCTEIGRVAEGDILVKLGQDGSWIKVLFGDDKEGWVYAKYVKDI